MLVNSQEQRSKKVSIRFISGSTLSSNFSLLQLHSCQAHQPPWSLSISVLVNLSLGNFRSKLRFSFFWSPFAQNFWNNLCSVDPLILPNLLKYSDPQIILKSLKQWAAKLGFFENTYIKIRFWNSTTWNKLILIQFIIFLRNNFIVRFEMLRKTFISNYFAIYKM